MTNIQIRLRIEEPTDKINPKTVEPLLKELRQKLKVYMEENLPNGSVIKIKRITEAKKGKMQKKVQCLICKKDFKTIMSERKLCSNCVRTCRGIDIDPSRFRVEQPATSVIRDEARYIDSTEIGQPTITRSDNDHLEYYDNASGRFVRL